MNTQVDSHPFLRRLFRVLRVLLLIYVGFLLFLAGCQRRLIYYPSKTSESVLRRQAERAGMVPWENGDGNLIGWKTVPGPSSEPPANRLVVFHGNAGLALHRTYFRDGFAAVGNGEVWQIFLFEYPGYGARSARRRKLQCRRQGGPQGPLANR